MFKKLVKDIGDLTPTAHKERKKIFYMMIAVSLHTFCTEVNKKIQSDGLISLEYDKTTANLINSKNRLKFNILNNIQREFITVGRYFKSKKNWNSRFKNNKFFNYID